jgi:hypothetical protein
MCSSVRANDLPRRLFGNVADQDASNVRRARLTNVLDFLGVCASGSLSGDLLIPDLPLRAAS